MSLANAPSLCPSCARQALSPVPDLCGGLLRCKAVLPESVAYVGPGWYPKVSLAAMLDLGVCRWDPRVGLRAEPRDAATLRRALERMDAAWSKGEEHMAKLT